MANQLTHPIPLNCQWAYRNAMPFEQIMTEKTPGRFMDFRKKKPGGTIQQQQITETLLTPIS
jgi:hypothetical protein